jgi:hypothetical protein
LQIIQDISGNFQDKKTFKLNKRSAAVFRNDNMHIEKIIVPVLPDASLVKLWFKRRKITKQIGADRVRNSF